MHLSFVDLNGVMIPPIAEPWKDTSRSEDATTTKEKNLCNSKLLMLLLLFGVYSAPI